MAEIPAPVSGTLRLEKRPVGHVQSLSTAAGDDGRAQMGVYESTDKPANSLASKQGISLDSTSDITYLYLTFETPLPNANVTIGRSLTPQPAPAPPDLQAYANPLLWPTYRKNMVLALSCVATFLTAYTAGSYSPPQHLIQADLNAPTNLSVLAGITTFCTGFALAPMVLAPFSEINGRYPVFVVSGIVFVVFQAVCGVVRNIAGMLVARFFTGIGGSVFSTMVGGVLADIWVKEDRNTPMAIYSGSVLVGTGAGPLITSIMTNRLASGTGNAAPWKWVFWHQVITGAVLMVALVFLFQESRGSVLLSRKAKALNLWYERLEEVGYFGLWVEDQEDRRVDAAGAGTGDRFDNDDGNIIVEGQGVRGGCDMSDEEKGTSAARGAEKEYYLNREFSSTRHDSTSMTTSTSARGATARLQRFRWRVKEDEERSSLTKMVTISLYRPFHLLFTEPVVFFFSLWVAFAWAVLYLTFGSVPLVFQRTHGWDIEQSGHVFGAMMVGSVLATAIGIWQESMLHHPKWQPSCPSLPSSSTGQEADAQDSRFWKMMRRRFPVTAPESRLYFTCLSSILLPAGLFMFGFGSRPDVHWAVPTIAVGIATMGIYSVYLATFNYLADTYHKYASSALAAQSFCRNILGGVFPLVTGLLFQNLGEARAGGLLGAVAAALTVVPWVLVFFGEKIRARSPFASVSFFPSSLLLFPNPYICRPPPFSSCALLFPVTLFCPD
jgi:hypothetical protein